MKVLSALVSFAVFGLCVGENIVSLDEVKDLILKYGRHNLTKQEHETLLDVFEVIQAPEYFTGNEMKSTGATHRSALPCIICNAAFGVLFDLVHEGKSDEYIKYAVTQLCTDLGIYGYNVCRGVIDLNVPIMTYIIRNTPEAKPQTFCSLIEQNNEDPSKCQLTDPRFDWTVELPEASSDLPVIKSDMSEPYTFVIVTDAHVDPLYEAYGVANCGEPTCCRKGQKPTTREPKSPIDQSDLDSSIVYSGTNYGFDVDKAAQIRESRKKRKPVRKPDYSPAGYWGDYRSCDTPIWAFDDVIGRITETHKKVDAVYYIGDSIDHGVWETSYDLIKELNEYIANKFRKGFGDDVLVVPSIGNHESQPTNQFAPAYVTEEKLSTLWLYKNLADKWSHYLTEDAKESLTLNGGGFSVLFKDKLRIISINNNIAYRYNWWLVFDPLDSKRHLEWLVDELQKAEKAGEIVHILAHIPPGVNDLTHTWTREYNRVINRFSSIIAAEFNGHTHTDEFKIFYNQSDSTQAINVAWGGGGATAYANYNLNYKIITLDSNTYELNTITNYIYNLTEANLTPNKRPHWFELYDFNNSFRLKDLKASTLNDLVYRMATNEKTLLSLYSVYFSKLSDNKFPSCDLSCQVDYLCKMVVTVLWDRRKCEELKGLYLATIRNSQQLN